jgi:hypothetical protein
MGCADENRLDGVVVEDAQGIGSRSRTGVLSRECFSANEIEVGTRYELMRSKHTRALVAHQPAADDPNLHA